MPKLRPPGGRRAAAIVQEPELEVNDEAQLVSSMEQAHIEGEEGPDGGSDPTVALKAQIEKLERANRSYAERVEAERLRAEQALQRAQERDLEVSKLQEQTVNSQQDAINAALTAAQSEAEAAQREIESAASIGDTKAQGEAYRRLSRAEARIVALESGKESLERDIRDRKAAEPPRPEPRSVDGGDAIDKLNIPLTAKTWLRKHPEYLSDQRKNAKIQAAHWDVVDEGIPEYTDEYYEVLEEKLGLRQPPRRAAQVEEDDMDDEPVAPLRRSAVSAPPSREPPTQGLRSTQIKLTPAQKEAARIAGVEEKEYAKQLMRLRDEKANGNYGGQP